MNTQSLSLHHAPDISIPLRFFLTAPLFAMAAMLLWLIAGPELLHNRWLPQTLAFTHLITLGFITMIMLGALFQILPVLSGQNIMHSRVVSALVHALFTPGIIFLASGFYMQHSMMLYLALICLGSAFTLFLVLLSWSLFSIKASHASLRGVRMAVTALWISVALGLWLLFGHAADDIVLARQHTSLHLAWAALGWVTTMIVSLAFQVIPMFQITHDYPPLVSNALVPSLFSLLVLWSLAHFAGAGLWLQTLLAVLICMLLLIFVSITLNLQWERKRRSADASLYFWFTGLTAIFSSMLLMLYAQAVGRNLDGIIGLIFFFGFVISIINAMLYKIVPFLVWFNLSRKLALSAKRKSIPLMNDVISQRQGMRQFMVHISALLLSLTAFMVSDVLFYLAATLWLLNFALLWTNMLMAVNMYRKLAAG